MGEVIKHFAQTKKAKKILTLVADSCGAAPKKMAGTARHRELVDARRIFSVMCRKYLNMTVSSIGKLINRDHATILYYIKNHKGLYKSDYLYRHYYDICEYAMTNNNIAVQDTPSYIDALVAENKHLKDEIAILNKKLDVIQEVMEV